MTAPVTWWSRRTAPRVPRHGAPDLHRATPVSEIDELLADYAANGVHNILALAGDPPADGSDRPATSPTPWSWSRRCARGRRLLRGRGGAPGAAPPFARPGHDRRYLADKLDAADLGITQFFFDADDYFRMVDELSAWAATPRCSRG